ncbi:MAG: cytidine deaminase family protein [Candidatus Izemoplasmataceae bacterium]
MDFEKLYNIAFEQINHPQYKTRKPTGFIGAVLCTDKGNIYTGICEENVTSLEVCAERIAATEMIKHGETKVIMMISVNIDGEVVAPCKDCRTFIGQLDDDNLQTEVFLAKDQSLTLKELLPLTWQ